MYAVADVHSGQDPGIFEKDMERTLESMKADLTFSINDVLKEGTDAEHHLTERQKLQVDRAIARACLNTQSTNVFVDLSTSTSRNPEFAVDATTCIRPTHGIFSNKLQRCLHQEELWSCQGLWPNDFADPKAVQEVFKSMPESQDLCGNAFASTSCQAKLISSLVHSSGWRMIDGTDEFPASLPDALSNRRTEVEKSDPSCPNGHEEKIEATPAKLTGVRSPPASQSERERSWKRLRRCSSSDFCAASPKLARGKDSGPPKRKLSFIEHATPPPKSRKTSGLDGKKASEPDTTPRDMQIAKSQKAPVLRRMRGKQKPKAGFQKLVPFASPGELQKIKDGKEKPSEPRAKRSYKLREDVVRKGKRPCVSIWQKVQLFKEFWQQDCATCRGDF